MSPSAYQTIDTEKRARLLSSLLINGAMERPNTAEHLKEFDITLNQAFFCVALIPDYEWLPEGNIDEQLSFIERSACSAHPSISAYAVLSQNMIVLILCRTPQDDSKTRLFEDVARYLVDMLRSEFKADFSIYLGVEVYSPRDIPASFRTATSLYESTFLKDGNRTDSIITSRPTLSGQDNTIFLSELHLMLGYLLNAEFTSAAQILDRVFDIYIQENKYYPTTMSERLEFFVATFHQAVEDAIADNVNAIHFYMLLKRRLDTLSYPIPKEIISQVYQDIAKVAEDAVEQRHQSMIGPAMETRSYIDNHYTDATLDITTITEALGYSTSYLTRLFKSAYSMTILNYITSKRVSAAEGLLRETNCTVEQIAVRVGYNSISTFTRAFYKLNGTSPNQYRKTFGRP